MSKWEEYFKNKYGEANVSLKGRAKFAPNYDTHLVDVEDLISKGGKGVVGGHNMNNFNKAFTDRGWNVDDCIISKTPHPSIPGLYQIEYQIPAMKYGTDGELVPIANKFKKIGQPKTVYDPSIISDSQILEWGRQAMEEGLNANRTIINTNPKVPTNTLEGYVTVNGIKLKFVGYPYKTTGEIKNFYPVFD